MYKNCKIYGPYQSNRDHRLRVFIRFPNGRRTTVSYPKFIMENYLDRYLEKEETVDHIDGDYLNNEISNLQILKLSDHTRIDVIRNKDIYAQCVYCGREFVIKGSKLHTRNRVDKHQSGYFCSRSCSGKYGREIQLGIRVANFYDRIIPERYKLKDVSAHKDNFCVDTDELGEET